MIANLHRKLEIPADILIQPERKATRHRASRLGARTPQVRKRQRS